MYSTYIFHDIVEKSGPVFRINRHYNSVHRDFIIINFSKDVSSRHRQLDTPLLELVWYTVWTRE